VCVNLAAMMASQTQMGGAMQAGGSVLQAIGSIAAGDSVRSMANSQADMVRTQAEQRARSIRRAAVRETGGARSAAAASGVSLNSGSVLEAEREIAQYSEQDALSVLVSGQAQATQLRTQGRAVRQAGYFGAAESLIHGADAWARTRRSSGGNVGYSPGNGAY
jgi:hypothetical protein